MTSQGADQLRMTAGGRLHPIAGALWLLAIPVTRACAITMIAVFALPLERSLLINVWFVMPLLAVFLICDSPSITGKALPCPRHLGSWLSRVQAGRYIVEKYGELLSSTTPRKRHWQQVWWISHVGVFVMALPPTLLPYLTSVTPLTIAMVGALLIASLRVWHAQHLANWWSTFEPHLDTIHGHTDPMDQTLEPKGLKAWELEPGERFNLLNPWASVVDSDQTS